VQTGVTLEKSSNTTRLQEGAQRKLIEWELWRWHCGSETKYSAEQDIQNWGDHYWSLCPYNRRDAAKWEQV